MEVSLNASAKRPSILSLAGLVLLAAIIPSISEGAELVPEKLKQQLESPNRNIVLRTVHEVADWGPLASDLVPQLVDLLKTDDVLLQHDTAVALGQIGPAAADAVEPLTNLLSHKSILLQRSAADALGEIGSAATPAVPRLSAMLRRWDELFLKIALARAVIRIEPHDGNRSAEAIEVLTDVLQAGDDAVLAEASMALAEAGEPAVEVLTKLVGHSTPAVCWSACDALGEMGPLAASAVPALVKAVSGEHAHHHDVCWHSARALGLIHAHPEDSVPALIRLLSHRHAPVRVHTAYALAAFGHDAGAAAPELTILLQDDDVDVRLAAARSLGTIGSDDPEMIAALDAALEDSSGAVTVAAAESLATVGQLAVPRLVKRLKQPGIRSLAARVLADIGPDAEIAVPELLQILSTDDDGARRESVLALAQIGVVSADVEAAVTTILQQPDDAVRPEAAYALARLGIRSASPLLESAIRDQNSAMRIAAAWALVTLDAENPARADVVVPLLTTALADESPSIRRESAATLSRLGSLAQRAVPALVKTATDSNPQVRIAVMGALVEIARTNIETLKAVAAGLKDDEAHVRHAALYAAGRMGPAARDTGALLRQQLSSREALERFHAAWALVRVLPDDAHVLAAAQPELIAGLHFDDAGTRAEAARTLGLTRSPDPQIRKALEDVLNDENAVVSEAAKLSLKQLDDSRDR